MRNFVVFCGLLCAMSGALGATEPGIVFGQNTRMVFSLAEKAKGLSVSNLSDTSYLLHATVVDANAERTVNSDFMVTPELLELKPNQNLNLTIRRLGGDYPEDRESLLYLVGKFIPHSASANKATNQLELAYSVTMKVFLRPKGLVRSDDAVDAFKEEIEFSYDNKQLSMRNRSPYHLTFHHLVIDGKTVDLPKSAKVLMPFATHQLPLPTKPKRLKWAMIGDSGYETSDSERILT